MIKNGKKEKWVVNNKKKREEERSQGETERWRNREGGKKCSS